MWLTQNWKFHLLFWKRKFSLKPSPQKKTFLYIITALWIQIFILFQPQKSCTVASVLESLYGFDSLSLSLSLVKQSTNVGWFWWFNGENMDEIRGTTNCSRSRFSSPSWCHFSVYTHRLGDYVCLQVKRRRRRKKSGELSLIRGDCP